MIMSRSLVHLSRALCAFALLLLSSVNVFAQSSNPVCTGRFPDFLNDICWSCVFPLKVMGNATLYAGGQEDSLTMGRKLVCNCGIKVGIPISFWEPSRMADVTRAPYCLVNLGGIQPSVGPNATQYGGIVDETSITAPGNGAGVLFTGDASFWQIHWYINPLYAALGLVAQSNCLENKGFDLAYLSELDPTHSDPELENLISPDAYLFGNLIAQSICGADCVAATVGFGLSTLYWCAGCNGSIFPLTGRVEAHVGDIQATSLVLQRLSAKLHRVLVQWSGAGERAMCGPYPQPLMDKRNYKYSVINPVAQTEKIAGRCCQPYGRTTTVFGAGKALPGRENYGYQIFRKRDCCQGAY